jgi:hypothetical protein
MGTTHGSAFQRGMMSAFDLFGGMGTMPIPMQTRRRRAPRRPRTVEEAWAADLAKIAGDVPDHARA